MTSRPWLLLDRDDTILDDPGYLSDPNAIRFLPGAVEGLQLFSQAGWSLVVVTNQSGIGRGLFDTDQLQAVHARFLELLERQGVTIEGIFHCPHAPDEGCLCRKPAPGLALQAAGALGLTLADSVVVGDKHSDLALGRAVGARYVAQVTAKSAPEAMADGHFHSLRELAFQLLGV